MKYMLKVNDNHDTKTKCESHQKQQKKSPKHPFGISILSP